MKCPSCRSNNPEGTRFCRRCGASLALQCPKCGAASPLDFKFCGQCGSSLNQGTDIPTYAKRTSSDYTPPFLVEKVLKGHSPLEGERKHVTVLFADVANFTSIAEALDPEDVHSLMEGCFEILGEEIHGAGGTINQYTGDGVMALFGAPIAYEDHTRRACHVALRIQARLREYESEMSKLYGISFKMRIGINTGSVVVASIGDNLRLDYTALGDTTNLAARLESIATPGKIWVSQTIRDAARPFFRFRKIGDFEVKGKENIVAAFSLLSEKREIASREKPSTIPIPFINRQTETALLDKAFHSVQKGSPCVIALEGEAGIGKTRLLEQFRSSLDHESVFYLAGRCQPYGEAAAFHPFSQMFKHYFQFSDRDGLGEIRSRIREKIRDKELLPKLERILSLFGRIRAEEDRSELIREGEKRDIFLAIRDLLWSCMSIRPIVMAVDDMQWVDATTKEFFGFLHQSTQQGPLLIILSGRTTSTRWCPIEPDSVIRPAPFRAEDALKIFNAALGADRLKPSTSEKIISSAGGNPLFLVEMGTHLNRQRMVVCDEQQCRLRLELEDMAIPETIRDVLAARLDSLPEAAKRVCRLASVIGSVFSHDVLKRLVEDEANMKHGLAVLEDEGIIDRISPDSGNRYAFRHQMMQQVTYHSLLHRSRKTYHRIVAETVEELHHDNLHNQLGFLSFHYYHAEQWPKALSYTLDAGHRARQSFSCREALTCFNLALDILKKGNLDQTGKEGMLLYKWIGSMHFCVREMEKSRLAFQKMLSLAKKQENREVELEALFRLGWVAFYSHRPRSSEHYLIKAVEQSKALGISEIHQKASSFLGQLYSVLGRLKKAKPLLIETLDLADEVKDPEGRAWSLASLIQYYNWTGDFDEALAFSKELARLNRKLNSAYFEVMLHFRQGLILGALGRLEEAEKTLRAGLGHLEAGGDPFWRPRLLNTLGWVLAEKGDVETALEFNRQSLEEALPTGDPETINNARINIGENMIQMDRLDDAEKILRQSREEVSRQRIAYTLWRYKTRLFIVLAELRRKTGEREKALSLAGKAFRSAKKMGAKKHEAMALHVRGKVLKASRPKLAMNDLNKSLSLAEKMNARILVERIKREINGLP